MNWADVSFGLDADASGLAALVVGGVAGEILG
jgi:hypothetical protein